MGWIWIAHLVFFLAASADGWAVSFFAAGLDSIRHISGAVRFAGTLVETISLDESERTLDAVIAAAGVTPSSLPRRHAN